MPYFAITKPRMVVSNLLVAAAAFIFGSHGIFSWQSFVLMFAGLGLVIAGGCVFNNRYDHDIDLRMERTKARALALEALSYNAVLIYGAMLLSVGTVLLWFVNHVALVAALVGAISYVALYTPLKHYSRWALLVGALAGATPPIVGYAAATGRFDATALLLGIILYIWQLPHFIAISMYRFNEYKAAGVPLFIKHEPSELERRVARAVFYCSLVALLAFCVGLILQR